MFDLLPCGVLYISTFLQQIMFKFYKCHKEIGKLLEKDKEQQMS
jgi:hypothetical protein